MLRLIIISLLLVSCTSMNSGKFKGTLKNGSSVVVRQDEDLPRQVIRLQFQGLVNQATKAEQAVFPVVSRILDQGPKGMSEEDYKQKLFLLNAHISFSASYRSYDVSVISPPQHLAETLDLALSTLRNPKLDDKTVVSSIAHVRNNIQSSFSSMRNVILYHAFKDHYQDHPLTFNGTTSPKGVAALTAKTVSKVYQRLWSLKHLKAYSVGPTSKKQLLKDMDHVLEKYNVPAFEPYAFTVEPMVAAHKVQIIHRPKVTDHQVLFVFDHAFKMDEREIVVAQALFDYFGGGLTGQLGMVLREARGLTYHASANYGRYLPSWFIYSFAGSKQLEPLLKGVIEVKNNSQKSKVTSKELNSIKSTLVADFKQAYELPMDDLSLEAYASLFDLDVSYLRKFPSEVVTVSERELEAYKAKILSNQTYSLYIMGDKNVISPILTRLGYKNIKVIEESQL